MPFQNIAKSHFSPADNAQTKALIQQLETLLQPKLQNLSPKENQKFGSLGSRFKLFLNKVADYREGQPALSCPDVDWTEFADDAADCKFLETSALRLEALANLLRETKYLHERDLFKNGMLDYNYSKYKAKTETGLGYDEKAEDLSQFFPNKGKRKKKAD